jgi:hypothetical protein
VVMAGDCSFSIHEYLKVPGSTPGSLSFLVFLVSKLCLRRREVRMCGVQNDGPTSCSEMEVSRDRLADVRHLRNIGKSLRLSQGDVEEILERQLRYVRAIQ